MNALIDQLEANQVAVLGHFTGLSRDDMRWKESPQKWSLLEVLYHLVDEETGDFRLRLSMTLENPADPWPTIDPEGLAIERRYNELDHGEGLAKLSSERMESIAWLRTLGDANWASAHEHPKLGTITAGDLLTSWVAHDFLHLRQIANIRLALLAEAARPHSYRYAAP